MSGPTSDGDQGSKVETTFRSLTLQCPRSSSLIGLPNSRHNFRHLWNFRPRLPFCFLSFSPIRTPVTIRSFSSKLCAHLRYRSNFHQLLHLCHIYPRGSPRFRFLSPFSSPIGSRIPSYYTSFTISFPQELMKPVTSTY